MKTRVIIGSVVTSLSGVDLELNITAVIPEWLMGSTSTRVVLCSW